VVFVAFDGVQSIDVAGPYEVFASAGEAAGSLGRRAGYRVRVASAHGGLVRTESGLELGSVPLPGPGEWIDTLVLPGGTGATAASADPDLIAFVRAAASRCRRVAAVCTGAFIAAPAGLSGQDVGTQKRSLPARWSSSTPPLASITFRDPMLSGSQVTSAGSIPSPAATGRTAASIAVA